MAPSSSPFSFPISGGVCCWTLTTLDRKTLLESSSDLRKHHQEGKWRGRLLHHPSLYELLAASGLLQDWVRTECGPLLVCESGGQPLHRDPSKCSSDPVCPKNFCEASNVPGLHLALAVWDQVNIRLRRGRLSFNVRLRIPTVRCLQLLLSPCCTLSTTEAKGERSSY